MTARILVVDDNLLNLKLLAAKLTHDYYLVTTAESGAEALEKIGKEKPDIILLDVMMPNMDGFETCKKIKADPATMHIPVVMVTALSDTADRVRGLEAGADDFLTKPINDLALMSRVRSLLRFKMIMDEWHLRESTSAQFIPTVPMEEASRAAYVGGRVLLLNDKPAEQKLINETLASIFVRVFFTREIAETATMAYTGEYDLVYVSLDLQNEDGLQLCSQLRTNEATRQLPMLLIASDTDMVRVAKGLDLGANDYLIRPLDANELIARTRTQLKHKRHYDRLRKNYEDSLALALVDPLTRAYNRRYLEAHLPRMMARSATAFKPLAALMIDVDHFKQINDQYLHINGDIVLREIVSRIMNSLRPSDLVVRMGGEEFAVIMPETNLATALSIGERLRERVCRTPVAIGSKQEIMAPVTISIGGASFHEGAQDTVDGLLKRADAALYCAKKAGRNRVVSEADIPPGEAARNG